MLLIRSRTVLLAMAFVCAADVLRADRIVLQRPETVSSVARRYGIQVDDFLRNSSDACARLVHPGMRLRIPQSNVIHTVRPGESLIGIAGRHHSKLSDLISVNGLGDRTLPAGVPFTVPNAAVRKQSAEEILRTLPSSLAKGDRAVIRLSEGSYAVRRVYSRTAEEVLLSQSESLRLITPAAPVRTVPRNVQLAYIFADNAAAMPASEVAVRQAALMRSLETGTPERLVAHVLTKNPELVPAWERLAGKTLTKGALVRAAERAAIREAEAVTWGAIVKKVLIEAAKRIR